jgi:hypothetical protein
MNIITSQDPNTHDVSTYTFSGNIYIFQAFDVGDDINFSKVQQLRSLNVIPRNWPKYFKNYHIPLSIQLPQHTPDTHSHLASCNLYSFGALSLTYKIPFSATLEGIRKRFSEISSEYLEKSVTDCDAVYKNIQTAITKPHFFQTRSSYIVMQVDRQHDIPIDSLQKHCGNTIASTLRFETEFLSEYQKNEILDSAIGYFRQDLIIIDVDAAFVYDDEYVDLLGLFEFANVQQLELCYFDRLLDTKLNQIYEGEVRPFPITAYLPFIGMLMSDPIAQLGKLKADISVITERLDSSIKLAGEPFFAEIHEELVEKFDIKNWRDSIDRKLRIVEDIQKVHQHRIDITREDMLSVLVILLIFIELVLGILKYGK